MKKGEKEELACLKIPEEAMGRLQFHISSIVHDQIDTNV